MTARTLNVANAAQFHAAVRAARGGDTILMAPGSYGNLFISNRNPEGLVTIRSADPDNDAVIQQLRITRSRNFLIEDVDIANPIAPGGVRADAVQVNGARDISFVGIDMHGSLNGTPWDDARGMAIMGSSRIAVLDSRFTELRAAVTISRSSDVIVAGNKVWNAREGFNVAEGDDVLIERNLLRDFNPNLATGEHPDFIQVFSTGVGPTTDLVIRNNVMLQGDSTPIQGIFIRSERIREGVRHSNITIENNLYEGTSRHGISVSDAANVTVSGNTVLEGRNPVLAPAISLFNVIGGVAQNNVATLLQNHANNVGTSFRNNIDVWDRRFGGVARETLFEGEVGAIDFTRLAPRGGSQAEVMRAGYRPVGEIGDLAGSTAQQLGHYLPMFDQAPFA